MEEEEGERTGRKGEEEEEEEGGESHARLCVCPFGPSHEENGGWEGLRAETPPPPYRLRAR